MKRILAAFLATSALSAHAVVTPLPGATPQRAPALAAFPNAVAVRVTDEAGLPVAGVKAYFSQSGALQLAPGESGDCWLDFMIVFACRATTDAEGLARFPAMAARHAGTFTAHVQATNDLYPGTVNYGETMLQFTADALQEPARLTITQGDAQRVVIGTALAPITVRLADADGQPRRRAVVWYSPLGAPGGFDLPPNGPAEVLTDDDGLATLPRFTAGWGVGEHEAEVRHFDPQAAAYVSTTIRYTATNAQGGFELQLGDLWWGGAAESGWGMSINQRGERLFNVWFVYDEAGLPTWFVQPGGEWTGGLGAHHSGSLYWPRSAPWFAYDASKMAPGAPVGEGRASFQGPEAAWSSFFAHVGTSNPSFNKGVVRQRFGGSEPGPFPGVGGLWWGGASQNGWGVAIHEQGAKLFVVWFTYDADGMPTWFAMPDGAWSDTRTWSGTVYRTRGPAWTLGDFDPAQVQKTPVGSVELRFTSLDAARMDVTIDGRSVSLGIVRQLF